MRASIAMALSQRVQLLRLASESLTVTGAAQFAARVSSEGTSITSITKALHGADSHAARAPEVVKVRAGL